MPPLWNLRVENPDGFFHKLWHRATNYRFLNRKHHKQEWRSRSTVAWESRLPANRMRDNVRKPTISASATDSQFASPFFGKLPLEIRKQIYLEILGDDEILLCVTNEDTSLNGHEMGKEKIPFDLECRGAEGFLSFLMTCKRAYMESHSLLYTTRTIRLAGVTEYSCFTRLISRDNLDLIQKLHVQWSYEAAECERDPLVGTPPYHVTFWADAWTGISSWKGLKHVRVNIHKWDSNVRKMAYQEEYYLDPLKLLGNQIQLEVYVSWAKWEANPDEQPPDEERWPFVVRRNMRFCEDETGILRLAAQE